MADRKSARAVAAAAVRICPAQPKFHGAIETFPDGAGAARPRQRLGRSADPRRGVPPAAIRDFVRSVGVARAYSVVDVAMFEHAIRECLNQTAQRRMAVLRPLKLVIDNYPVGVVEELVAVN